MHYKSFHKNIFIGLENKQMVNLVFELFLGYHEMVQNNIVIKPLFNVKKMMEKPIFTSKRLESKLKILHQQPHSKVNK